MVEVLGVSEWDGVDRGRVSYKYGFLVVTHTGNTYYLNATSYEGRASWMLHVRAALEANFANEELVHFRPHKAVRSKSAPHHNGRCARTGAGLSVHSAHFCPSCGRGFSSAEFISESASVLQLGREESVRVCVSCADMQQALLWIKSLNYVNTEYLHQHSGAVQENAARFKHTFALQRVGSSSLDMAGRLFEQGDVTADELRELRAVEHTHQMDSVFRNSAELYTALELIGSDVQTILQLLLSSRLIKAGDRYSYRVIVNKLVSLAERDTEVVDFYWPQLLQLHCLESRRLAPAALSHVSILQVHPFPP